MKKQDITFITRNNLCFNCGACVISCHMKCINLHMTNAGRLHPIIDYSRCTNCGACFDVCPGFDRDLIILDNIYEKKFYGEVIASYIGRATDNFIYKNSQSGGMVTATLDYLFSQKLIDYALVVKMDHSIEPIPKYFFATSTNELFDSQKSIYAPVDLLTALDRIEDLKGDLAVVGLPCHIEGVVSLKKHNPKKYKRIKYKLGLICGGTLSYIVAKYFSQGISVPHKIIFRDKENISYLHSNVTLEDYHRKKIKVVSQQERFILKELITPPRCYICFDKMNIHADLVFGDPWGLDGYNKISGDSIVISRNSLGEEVIQRVVNSSKAILKKIDYGDILIGQKINERIKQVFTVAKVYQELGFQIPNYFKTQKSLQIDKNLKKQIVKFLKMEEIPIEKNVINIKKYIHARLKKSKIKQLIKKLFLVEKWKKIR